MLAEKGRKLDTVVGNAIREFGVNSRPNRASDSRRNRASSEVSIS